MPLTLFADEHFTGSREITSSESIKINSTRYRLPELISTIPICRARFVVIYACRQVPYLQCSYEFSIHRMNRNVNLCWLRQLIRHPRLRVKRIRVVRQQCRFFWQYLCESESCQGVAPVQQFPFGYAVLVYPNV